MYVIKDYKGKNKMIGKKGLRIDIPQDIWNNFKNSVGKGNIQKTIINFMAHYSNQNNGQGLDLQIIEMRLKTLNDQLTKINSVKTDLELKKESILSHTDQEKINTLKDQKKFESEEMNRKIALAKGIKASGILGRI